MMEARMLHNYNNARKDIGVAGYHTAAAVRTARTPLSPSSSSPSSSSLLSPPPPPSPSSSSWTALVTTPCERPKIVPRACVEGSGSGGALVPVCWDVLVSIYRELVGIINRLPFKKKLVVCIVFRGGTFRLDLGEVRAAGVVCLIGLGLSLGSLLLYRLYFRIVVPFLQTVCRDRGPHSVIDDEYTLHLESSSDASSEVDDSMGNSNSKKPTPAVYYSPNYGVRLGSKPPSLDLDCEDDLAKEEGILLQPQEVHTSQRHKSPSPASDKDSAIGGVGGGSEMSHSYYSERSTNRDSFYSNCTAESGFDDFLQYLDDARGSMLGGSKSSSLKEANSLREKNFQMLYRAHRGRDPGLNNVSCNVKPSLDAVSDCSSQYSGIVSSRSHRSSCDSGSSRIRTNIDPLVTKYSLENFNSDNVRTYSRQSSDKSRVDNEISRSSHSGERRKQQQQESDGSNNLAFTALPNIDHSKISSTQSTPLRGSVRNRRGRVRSPYSYISQSGIEDNPRSSSDRCYDYDPSLDVSESIRSFNSSADEIEWDAEEMEGDRDRMSTLPEFHQSSSDLHFKQSLMQRIQEWSSFANEYNKSRSPTPNDSPVRFVRRSRSLDRHIGDPSSVLFASDGEVIVSKPIEIEPVTEKNLTTLEYELHDIQGEFESITTKLHELIEQGNSDVVHTHSPSKSSSILPSSQHLPPLEADQLHGPAPSSPTHCPESTPKSIKISHKMRTRWERVPNSICSDSSRSSRAASVEFAWDLADYTHSSNNSAINSTSTSITDPSPSLNPMPEGGGASSYASHWHGGRSPEGFEDNENASEVINVCLPVDVSAYAEAQLKGDTSRARLMRKGYNQIPLQFSCHRLSVIRGDNYCGLRSSLFQVLAGGERITRQWPGIIGIMDSLHDLFYSGTAGLADWTFANRLPKHRTDKLASLSKCALSLYATIEEVCNLPSSEDREKRIIGLFNSGPTFDLELMEGMKVMMLLKLVEMKKLMDDGEAVPIFGHLLFARDTSETVTAFVHNHLNCVGDSAGVEQMEMCLLGYTLGVKLRVLRLSQYGQQDFDCTFPEDVPMEWPEVKLIAEDDRHYNVPLP